MAHKIQGAFGNFGYQLDRLHCYRLVNLKIQGYQIA